MPGASDGEAARHTPHVTPADGDGDDDAVAAAAQAAGAGECDESGIAAAHTPRTTAVSAAAAAASADGDSDDDAGGSGDSSSSDDDPDSDDDSDGGGNSDNAGEGKGAAAIDDTKCCVCSAAPKYRCPRCSRRSCSAECVKKHKATYSCSGVQARSEYAASVRELNDGSILSDYYLMEDAARLVGGASRGIGRPDKRRREGGGGGGAAPPPTRSLPAKLRKLVQAVERQGGRLLVMPDGFERRKINQSYFDERRGRVLWTVRWEFPLAQAQYIEHRLADDVPVGELLGRFVAVGPDTVVRRQRLKPYFKPGSNALDHLRVTVAAERCPPGADRSRECPLDRTLRDVVGDGITLIEFPVLTVSLR